MSIKSEFYKKIRTGRAGELNFAFNKFVNVYQGAVSKFRKNIVIGRHQRVCWENASKSGNNAPFSNKIRKYQNGENISDPMPDYFGMLRCWADL